MDDLLSGDRRDADGVAGDAVELDRADEARHGGRIALDQIGVVQIVAAQNAGAGHADGVVVHVLALHPPREPHAGRVLEDLVGRHVADEPECGSGIGQGGDDTGDVAEDAVAAQWRGCRIDHTGRRTMERVVGDQAAERRLDVEGDRPGARVVVADLAGRRAGEADGGARADDRVVADDRVGDARARDQDTDARAGDRVALDDRPGDGVAEP